MEIDINTVAKQPVSDDPELAKILSGVNSSATADNSSLQTNDDNNMSDLQFEGMDNLQMPEVAVEQPAEIPTLEPSEPVIQPISVGMSQPSMAAMPSIGGLDLDGIKSHALEDLRPLVEKLTVSNEEKFDIYLLLLRSSDDNTLIEPAYSAARAIEDETKRANALLDVIKEIDYFKSK